MTERQCTCWVLLWNCGWDGYALHGIYTSRERAEAERNKQLQNYCVLELHETLMDTEFNP